MSRTADDVPALTLVCCGFTILERTVWKQSFIILWSVDYTFVPADGKVMTGPDPRKPWQQTFFVLGEETLAPKWMTSAGLATHPMAPSQSSIVPDFHSEQRLALAGFIYCEDGDHNHRYQTICPFVKLWVRPSALESH